MAPTANYYDILGVKKTATRRRDQEGVSQARAQAPPRRGRRGREVQGDQRGLRDALRQGEARGLRPVRPVLRRQRAAGLPPGGRRRVTASAGRRLGVHATVNVGDLGDLGDLFGERLRRRRAGAGAPGPQPQRGRDVEMRLDLTLRAGVRRHLHQGRGRRRRELRHVRRLRRQAGHRQDDLRDVRRDGQRQRGPGHVRLLAAVPDVRRRGLGHRVAVLGVPRPGQGARAQAGHGQRAGRRERRRQAAVQGQGRAGRQRRPCGRPVRDHAHQAAPRTSRATAPTWCSSCRSRSPRRRSVCR